MKLWTRFICWLCRSAILEAERRAKAHTIELFDMFTATGSSHFRPIVTEFNGSGEDCFILWLHEAVNHFRTAERARLQTAEEAAAAARLRSLLARKPKSAVKRGRAR